MVAANIKVFLRIRPSARPSKTFSSKEGEVVFETDPGTPVGQVNNTRTMYKFRFSGILGMPVTQEEVFDAVAKPVIDDVMEGINGTIFAYGQTGSGKTFTITGGAERYADRGLIPRTITYLFEAFKQRKDATFRLYISYLEIYNDAGYDLLSRSEGARTLEDLPKVVLREDEDGNIHLRNLSVNVAQKAEDALNLLFLGDTNRVVAQTPMNDASTRSHCMFILWVDSTKADSDTVRRAKLHLVDLAGSERISKTGVEGTLQKEARYINLSLHYLEQVIVALHERSTGARAHVPYRNSMMTSVLRDSLGGNCKTVMVGTCAVEDHCIDETISTCRFAQRVAAIKNNATINEELDPALLIKRLKKEVAELKDELTLLNSDGSAELTDADREECRQLAAIYLEQQDPEVPFTCGSVPKFQECFRVLRDVYWQRQGGTGGGLPTGPEPSAASACDGLESTVMDLRQQVADRDHELGMLIRSLSRRTGNSDGHVFIRSSDTRPPPDEVQAARLGTSRSAETHGGAVSSSAPPPSSTSADLLLDRNKAFEMFRKSVRRTESLEEGREVLKKLVAEAKALGEKANAARMAINAVNMRVEKERMSRALESMPRDPESEGSTVPDSPEIQAMLQEKEEQKCIYKQCTERLKQVKPEIDSYKATLEQNKERLQRDFEAWYVALQASQGGVPLPAEDSGPGDGTPLSSARALQEQQRSHSLPTTSRGPVMQDAAAAAAGPAPSSAGAARAKAEPLQTSLPRPAASEPGPSALPPSATAAPPKLTGHAETDSEIAAYFAAIANLQR